MYSVSRLSEVELLSEPSVCWLNKRIKNEHLTKISQIRLIRQSVVLFI